jgi:hypothetical protein
VLVLKKNFVSQTLILILTVIYSCNSEPINMDQRNVEPQESKASAKLLEPSLDVDKTLCVAEALKVVPGAKKFITWINGSVQCQATSCSGTMSPIQCKAAWAGIMACIGFQEYYSYLCYDGPDASHQNKIKERYRQLAKCASKCGINHADELAEWAAKFGKKGFGKCAQKILFRVLGPIGAAYTIGQLGSWGVNVWSDNHVKNMQSEFACKQKDDIYKRMQNVCDAAEEARNKFTKKYCSISWGFARDNCSIIGLSHFEPGSDCDQSCLNCDTQTEAITLFKTAAEETLYCGLRYRTYDYYRTICAKKPWECTGQDSKTVESKLRTREMFSNISDESSEVSCYEEETLNYDITP